MFLFAHLGIGSRLVRRFSGVLSYPIILLGTILPDLIDKSLYYGLSWTTGKQGLELGLIHGTRTFAHTAVFLLSLTLLAWAKRSKFLAALSLGVASHLLLDSLADHFSLMTSGAIHPNAAHTPLLWPLAGWEFPVFPYHNLKEHISIGNRPYLVWGEIAGALCLIEGIRNEIQKSGNPEIKAE